MTIATQNESETLDAFRRRLRGRLLLPVDAGFAEATRLWNGMIDKTPALVVQPTGTADVVAAVEFARDHGLLLSVRGGGHNIAGTALADGGPDRSTCRGCARSSSTPRRGPRPCRPGACWAMSTARRSCTAWPRRWGSSPRSASRD